ncbi:hypothetical protein L486_01001 [Kwoniella mangroviensis CBS 10435]|uniref:Uncharacterized protein n=1 Tax=Kwoniella mangroviensis CBS 10435 TaxID=1331196 RepID=A0A1B9J0R3_9TREE|nr:uncharacterized protein I203_06073 [Kwoniella mangroviensis CBS 8507]OCF61353.1 hypothetical protein L486_01001 [Kwoniella mangroviensis CBS 10435]OCF64829.1 hypothetical protein I203_06073 [Kwoniella mangroviensis CBS 8507]
MPSLLDLEDETIRAISRYTNKDTYIPIPSYGPHYQHFKSEINSRVSRDLLSFRSTCKRIHSLSGLDGLHVKATQGTKTAKWMSEAPREVEQGVRRLEICAPFLTGSDLISTFSALIMFLHRFEDLEELIIGNNPNISCYHLHGYTTSPDQLPGMLKLPLFPFLPKLTSLSVEVACPSCAEQIPKILVPAAPNIQHLKLAVYGLPKPLPLGQFTDADPWDESPDPSEVIRDMVTMWCKKNQKDTIGLKTLYMRYWPRPDERTRDRYRSTFKRASEAIPSLEEFRVAEFNGITGNLKSGISVKAEFIHDIWTFECDATTDEGDESRCCSLEETLVALSMPPKIKIFDPIFVLNLPLKRPTVPIASTGHTRSSYLASRSTTHRPTLEEVKSYENTCRDVFEAAAQTMVDTVPSLEEGYFWEKGTEISKKDWYLWKWKKVIVNGASQVEVDQFPEMMSSDFISGKPREPNRFPRISHTPSGIPMPMDDDDNDSERDEGEAEVDLAIQMTMGFDDEDLMLFGPHLNI